MFTHYILKHYAMKLRNYFMLLLICNLSMIQLIKSQNQIWSLPPFYVNNDGNGNVDYDPLPAPGGQNLAGVDNYNGQPASFSHNAMQDKDGNLLFFVVDGKVYDKNGEAYIINEMTNFTSAEIYGGFAETMIIPEPGSCSRYYIFSVIPSGGAGCQGPGCKGNQSLWVGYSILDLEFEIDPISWPGFKWGLDDGAASGIPQPVVKPLPLPVGLPTYVFSSQVHFAATDLNANNERYIYVAAYSRLTRYKLTSSGLFLDGDFGDLVNLGGDPVRSEMELVKLANGNYRLALPIVKYESTPISGMYDEIAIFEIDPVTGVYLPGSKEILQYDLSTTTYAVNTFFHNSVTIKGLEFSPDGNYLYITRTRTSQFPNAMDVYSVGSGLQPSNIPGLNLPNFNDFKFSQIELGVDGKLYFATNNRLATYSNPNNPFLSPATQWNNNALTLSVNYNLLDYWQPFTGNDERFMLYPLPDQIDGMDYSAHFTTNLACCIENTAFSTTTYNHEQGGVQNWTTSLNPFGNASTITVKDELVIKNGANIVANGLTFEFAPDAKLVVERGAIFTINGCTLTVETTCENTPMWNGVDVQGPTANQQSVDAGRFIANNSLIEHAYWATHNYSTAKGAPGVFWETGNRGGVILATNTTFRNNHRATVFFDFQNTNGIDDQSKFYNCTFVTDAPLNKPNLTPTVIMAHLFGVQGVNFLGCDFKFTSTDPSIAAHERGSGIEAYNCLLTVNSTLTGGGFPDRSNFVNLTRGVDAYSSIGSPRTTRVTNSDFDNVWRCIYLKSNELATITNNTFDVASDNAWSHGYGLYLDYCNRFKVENNAFTTTHNGFIGTYTWDSQQGTNNNEIYRNTFSNFVIGSQAAGNNGNRSAINGGLGLEYRCNNYTNINNADIYVSSGWIKPFHGQCGAAVTAPSNNKFSYTAQYGDFLQDTIVDHVSYQHSIGANLAPRNGYYYAPNTNPTVCNDTYNAATSCPTRIRRSRIELMQELSAEKLVVSNLNEGIAVGDAKALYEAIQTQSAGNVKNVLMAASPYLSDNVLIAYMQSNAPIGNLKQVLLANSPLSDDVMAALNQLNIPRGIKTQIINAQTGISAMQELKTEIAYHKNEVSKIQNDVLRYILFEDDVVERYKEAIEFIKQESACFEKRCELIAFYTVNKEYTKAEQELSDIAQYQENADFVKLYSNIVQLEQATDAIEELKTNTSILQPVIEVAEMPIRKQETAMAEVMLKQAKLRNYQEPIEELNVGGSGLRLMKQEEKNQSAISYLQSAITVYPNPTSNKVNITHNLNLENGKVTFKVYNMLGVEVINEYLNSTNNEVKVNTLKPGVYFYTITQNNQTIKTDKLMVK